MNPFKKLVEAKRKAEGSLQEFGSRYIAGRSTVNNETNPNWVVNQRKKQEEVDTQVKGFMDYVKKRGKVR